MMYSEALKRIAMLHKTFLYKASPRLRGIHQQVTILFYLFVDNMKTLFYDDWRCRGVNYYNQTEKRKKCIYAGLNMAYSTYCV